MKKLSLMLVFVLVLSLVLVACGDETETSSTPATESSVAATESTEESTEATEESSEAAVEESSEAAVEESSEAVEESTEAPVAGDENIAAGKSYTHSVLFRQGGADVGWGHDPNAPEAYPDEGECTLTDGVIPADDALYSAVEWVGFNSNDPDYLGYHFITVDLGAKTDLAKFVFKYGTVGLGQGISAPMTIEIYVSDDGQNWGDAVAGDVPDNDETVVNGVCELEAGASAQYVQFRFTSGGWAFISEVEVYGVAE